jgi:alkaline phosphatase D
MYTYRWWASCLFSLPLLIMLLGSETAAAAVTFTHGVASGEVKSNSAVLWTRVNRKAKLVVELSPDHTFPRSKTLTRIARATARNDFTAKAVVAPLSPGKLYHYRWRQGQRRSQIGTFKTPPQRSARARVSFTFTGDTDGTFLGPTPFHNNFEVLDRIREEDADFFVYLGDTVYADSVLKLPAKATTLEEFRDLYKVNRGFSALANLLKSTSTYAIWDDHEVRDNFAGQTVDPTLYATGRTAFLEYLPLQNRRLPVDPNCAGRPLFRVFHWGKDVEIIILDERSCRSPDVSALCSNDLVPTLPPQLRAQLAAQFPNLISPMPPEGCLNALFDPSRTMLGSVQKALFKAALLRSRAKFKFVINGVPIQQYYAQPYDRWEGYGAERNEVLNFIRSNRIENVVFLTTDLHANLINRVFIDRFADPETIAQEFTTGPVAAFTLEEGIHQLATSIGVDPNTLVQGFNTLFNLLGVDCRDLGGVRPLLGGTSAPRFTYGLVEVKRRTATITLKDQEGNVLADKDPLDPSDQCMRTLGP